MLLAVALPLVLAGYLLGGGSARPVEAKLPDHAPPLVGVQTHLMWSGVDRREIDRQLDAARAAGSRIVRVDVSWASLQPESRERWSAWELRRLDRVVRRAKVRGLKLLLTFWETPCWASTADPAVKQGCQGEWWKRGVQLHPPVDPRDYAAALARVVARYGRRVKAWELWNEPNSKEYFRSPDPARDYAAMVKLAYRAAKRAHRRPLIVAGSLMHADHRFTELLYRHGIRRHFDAFSIHPYSDGRSPLDPGKDRWMHASFARGVPATREVMLAHRDARPIWLTEFGWNTSDVRGDEPWRNGVDEETQAEYVEQALRKAGGWDYVDVAIYFGLRDLSGERTSPNDNFGLLRHDGGEKPAYGAFRAAALTARPSSRAPR